MTKKITLKKLLKMSDGKVDTLLKERAADCKKNLDIEDIRRERDYRTQKRAASLGTRAVMLAAGSLILAMMSFAITNWEHITNPVIKQFGIGLQSWGEFSAIEAALIVIVVLATLVLVNIWSFRWGRFPFLLSRGAKVWAIVCVAGVMVTPMVVLLGYTPFHYLGVRLGEELPNEFVIWPLIFGVFVVPLLTTALFILYLTVKLVRLVHKYVRSLRSKKSQEQNVAQ